MQQRELRFKCEETDSLFLDHPGASFSDIEYESSEYDSDGEVSDAVVEVERTERESSIPEFDVGELIDLTNQLVANDDLARNDSSVRHRFVQVRSVNEARDIILNHERTGSINGEDMSIDDNISNETNRVIPSTIPTDESGGIPSIRSQRQPMWLELTGLATVVIFLIAVYRLVSALVSISAFSENAINDVFEYVNYINERGYYDSTSNVSAGDSLIFKFSNIIKEEMPYLPDTIWMAVTLISFSIYTLFTSSIVFTSMMFSAMCLSVCCIVRWKHLADFVMNVFETI
ncbi:hypothetical protein CANINC_001083 [Pichia inconspicua]|uniref:Uncharacterized protein n=1 Tax=Pichia inconspicua TaxID=52247 RepID=A0A4T0X4K7_9ASCO|nr:hypothetical protein CANINC_001083 [[Candida] inconspicua]